MRLSRIIQRIANVRSRRRKFYFADRSRKFAGSGNKFLGSNGIRHAKVLTTNGRK